MGALLGLDAGTSGCKAILIDFGGNILAAEVEDYPLRNPRPGWYEQDPEDWYRAACAAARRVLKRAKVAPCDVKCIGLSAQMHGLVALDRDLKVLRPAILWNDQRTKKQCDEIIKLAGGLDELLKMTNNNMIPGYTAGKLLWVRENEPDIYRRIHRIVNPKDYLRLRLTGGILTEVSDASGTGLLDVRNRRWSKKLLDILGIDFSWLPPCFESTETLGELSGAPAEDMGLRGGIPVSGGGGDAVIQTTGSGLLNEGVLATIVGTAGVVASSLEKFAPNRGGELQVFCNNAPGYWHVMGVSLCAGASGEWMKRLLFDGGRDTADPYKTMDDWAASIEPGSGRLLFVPHLSGERCPHNDPSARGAFVGLTFAHSYKSMTRAVMEGVIYNMRQIYEKMPVKAKEIRTSGGSAKSAAWRQIQADIFKMPVKRMQGAEEGGAFGAALIAGVTCGVWKTPLDAVGVIKLRDEVQPNLQNAQIYDELFGQYKRVYTALKGINAKLSGIG